MRIHEMNYFVCNYLAELALREFVSRCCRHPSKKVRERNEFGNRRRKSFLKCHLRRFLDSFL